ncbi:L,D-transpeptidase family protein [Nitratifractor salsuginis]|uniref:ErfK/YbiS/YcfS/YnhG family protein n=1 Tax=Nitratifractor salsuginis (strain DSM 16511 / JCM 12458 / E9I37-1) TaxID=749222 RepID=E6WZP1_NITSE|nr:L,D-transpeptidase family protein [Nitratifractor salsuginis]ADV46682.1 ErfK/YbiS/YcfS/YnhG family protein [Nitratifractor salsuginis DSM 16511]
MTLRLLLLFAFGSLIFAAGPSAFKAVSETVQSLSVSKKPSIPKAQKVLIIKSERKLYLLRNGKPYREYHIALGKHPVGPKRREHDQKTPEGNYTLDFKKADSSYYRAIHVSYPNSTDKARAKRLGVNPGGAIMIHGQPNWFGWLSIIRQRFYWTAGCIAVSNGDMDEIWQAVDPGTPIEIRP